MASYYYYYMSLSSLLSLLCIISLAQSYNINGAGVTVDLIHRDSLLSPTETRFERLRNAFGRSFSRKASLLSTVSKSVDAVVDAPLYGGGGEYLIEYRLGTPPVRQLSVADTGSDITWIQCNPCTNCYKQDYPLFDPSATTSYHPLGCQEDYCLTMGSGCEGDVCQYQVTYGDRSHTRGDLATDTLTLGSNTSRSDFLFGCGKNNLGTFQSSWSGIFGLGNGPFSIVNQWDIIQGRFSYCFPPLDSNVTSKISFGAEAVVAGPNVLSTPLVSKDPPTFYFLTLEGFSIGEQRLNKPSLGDEGNIIIDSGTTLTFVPQELYQEMESTLVKAIRGTRVSDPQGTFSLCYKSDGGLFATPPITAHFKGADILLAEGSTFMEIAQGIFCFTVVPSQDLAIFGNLHQAGYLVGYDLVEKKINFLQTAGCTNSSFQ